MTVDSDGTRLLQMKYLDLSSGGTLDINDNAMILDGLSQSNAVNWANTLQSYLVNGYASGTWDGTMIVSGTAAANQNLASTVGSLANTQFDVWFGQKVAASDVLLEFTYYGDTNLDGAVDATDLGNMSSHYGTSTGASWVQGDTNYDGAVNLVDLSNVSTALGITPDLVLDAAVEGEEYTFYAPYDQVFDHSNMDELSSWTVRWGDGTSTTYTDEDGVFSHTYSNSAYGREIAVVAEGVDENSNAVTFTLPHLDLTIKPKAVTNFAASFGTGGTSAALSWTDASSIETGYIVKRQLPGGSWTTLTTLSPNSTSYTDSTTTAGPDGTGGNEIYSIESTGYTNGGGSDGSVNRSTSPVKAPTQPTPTTLPSEIMLYTMGDTGGWPAYSVTASWSPSGIATGAYSMHANESAVLTLSNLPAHMYVRLSAFPDVGVRIEGPHGLDGTTDGGGVQAMIFDDGADTTQTFTFTGSFNGWQPYEFWIYSGKAAISFGEPSGPLEIDEEVDVPVHMSVYDDPNVPMPNSTIDVKAFSDLLGFDSDAIEVSPSTVTTDAYGNGTVHVTAKTPGDFALQATDNAGDHTTMAIGLGAGTIAANPRLLKLKVPVPPMMPIPLPPGFSGTVSDRVDVAASDGHNLVNVVPKVTKTKGPAAISENNLTVHAEPKAAGDPTLHFTITYSGLKPTGTWTSFLFLIEFTDPQTGQKCLVTVEVIV